MIMVKYVENRHLVKNDVYSCQLKTKLKVSSKPVPETPAGHLTWWSDAF